ncbi:MAG: hypothetical protein IJI10_01450 [Eubacterium sp.]|nr:hypothetical protein [Eubacterium sp.]
MKKRIMTIVVAAVLFFVFTALHETTAIAGTVSDVSETGTTQSSSDEIAAYKNGFVNENGKTYYYLRNKKLKGARKIGRYYYYFDKKTGAMYKNAFRKVKGEKKYYYDEKGHKVFGYKVINDKSFYFDKKTGKRVKKGRYMGMDIWNFKRAGDINASMIRQRAKEVFAYIRKLDKKNGKKYVYGDSGAYPPCTDYRISCERLVDCVLYSMGFTNQPAGGYKLGADGTTMGSWLKSLGFKESYGVKNIKAGSIIFMQDPLHYHMFICDSISKNKMKRYDVGSNPAKIHRLKQPLTTRKGDIIDIHDGIVVKNKAANQTIKLRKSGFPYPRATIVRVYNLP